MTDRAQKELQLFKQSEYRKVCEDLAHKDLKLMETLADHQSKTKELRVELEWLRKDKLELTDSCATERLCKDKYYEEIQELLQKLTA
jgi:hypothetical protein